MFNTGFKTTKRSVNATPPIIYVGKPPVTLTPGKTWEIINMEKALKRVLRKKDFMFRNLMLSNACLCCNMLSLEVLYIKLWIRLK